MITLLAILKAGLAYVPIAPNWPEGRVRHVIEDAAPVLIITNQDRADVLYTAQAELPILKKREVVFYDELDEEALKLSSKNIPSNQALNQVNIGYFSSSIIIFDFLNCLISPEKDIFYFLYSLFLYIVSIYWKNF